MCAPYIKARGRLEVNNTRAKPRSDHQTATDASVNPPLRQADMVIFQGCERMGLWSTVWALSAIVLVILGAATLRRVRTGPKSLGSVSAHWVAQHHTTPNDE